MADHTDNYAVVGQPVSHSLSPDIHSLFARQTGQASLHYGRLELSAAQFAPGCREFFAAGGKGLNVTAPHKAAAMTLCDDVTDEARLAGAVNTIRVLDDGRLSGDNTDGPGLIRDLVNNLGLVLKGARILLLGAGGAGRGVVAALLAERPATLMIANRTRQTALAAARDFAHLGHVEGCGLDDPGDTQWDIVINATTASLAGQSVLISERVVGNADCYDMTYAAGGTPFTAWAKKHGAHSIHTGIGMLVEQAALSFRIWRGVTPDTRPVLARLARENGIEF